MQKSTKRMQPAVGFFLSSFSSLDKCSLICPCAVKKKKKKRKCGKTHHESEFVSWDCGKMLLVFGQRASLKCCIQKQCKPKAACNHVFDTICSWLCESGWSWIYAVRMLVGWLNFCRAFCSDHMIIAELLFPDTPMQLQCVSLMHFDTSWSRTKTSLIRLTVNFMYYTE